MNMNAGNTVTRNPRTHPPRLIFVEHPIFIYPYEIVLNWY